MTSPAPPGGSVPVRSTGRRTRASVVPTGTTSWAGRGCRSSTASPTSPVSSSGSGTAGTTGATSTGSPTSWGSGAHRSEAGGRAASAPGPRRSARLRQRAQPLGETVVVDRPVPALLNVRQGLCAGHPEQLPNDQRHEQAGPVAPEGAVHQGGAPVLHE